MEKREKRRKRRKKNDNTPVFIFKYIYIYIIISFYKNHFFYFVLDNGVFYSYLFGENNCFLVGGFKFLLGIIVIF